ncbi:MAG: methylated-DNA--[protein]-cysteine S-methyltransferase [Pseudomonadota bacterium]|nr:methylated-DNA--[protein]-cysteine S-methyltransferase [Pseudomonadota bacterium]
MQSVNRQKINYISFLSRVGWLTLFEESKKVIALEWGQIKNYSESPILNDARHQLTEYLDKKRTKFTIPLNPSGTVFEKAVWNKISTIPHGTTNTYGEVANNLNTAPRAIGNACGKNPIPIFIPCHRVVGKNNKLTGFSGGSGIETKETLILLERPVKNMLK